MRQHGSYVWWLFGRRVQRQRSILRRNVWQSIWTLQIFSADASKSSRQTQNQFTDDHSAVDLDPAAELRLPSSEAEEEQVAADLSRFEGSSQT